MRRRHRRRLRRRMRRQTWLVLRATLLVLAVTAIAYLVLTRLVFPLLS